MASRENYCTKETTPKVYKVNILGNDIECESDFELDEVYRPLQQYVEIFISEMGYESIESFTRALYGRQINLEDLVTAENISMLGKYVKEYIKKMNFGIQEY